MELWGLGVLVALWRCLREILQRRPESRAMASAIGHLRPTLRIDNPRIVIPLTRSQNVPGGRGSTTPSSGS